MDEFLNLSDVDDDGIDGLVVVLRLRTENEEDEVVRNEKEDIALIDEQKAKQSKAMFRV